MRRIDHFASCFQTVKPAEHPVVPGSAVEGLPQVIGGDGGEEPARRGPAP